jgi:hypothetical protein
MGNFAHHKAQMDADLAQRYFLAAQESPGGWLIAGIGLRAAAERLDYFKYPARDDESPISFISSITYSLA